MTVSGAALSSIGGGGGGSSYQIYDKATNDQPAVFTALSGSGSRDEYFTANPNELAAINNGPFAVGIGTTAEDPSSVPDSGWWAYIDGEWENILGTLVGADGQDGSAGSALEFASIAARDTFFAANASMLVNGLPVTVNLGNNMVANTVWNGPNSPTDYVASDERWRTASSMVSNNSLFVGSTQVSNAVENIVVTIADGRRFLAIGVPFTGQGSTRPFITNLAAETTLDVNTLSDQVLADPFTLNYQTFGDNLTTDFDFIPNEVGELRAQFYFGTDDSGPVIFDETRTVTQAEVDAGQFVSFGVGNAYLLDQDVNIFVRFSGIALRGGTVSGGQFDGQTIIAFRSTIQPFTRDPVVRDSDFTGSAVVALLQALTGDDRLDASAIKNLPPGGGSNPAATAADITRFVMDGQATSVLAPATISGTRTFSFNVNHPEDIDGTLSLVQNGQVLRSNIDPTMNTFTQAVTNVTLQANNQVVFELRGTSDEGLLVSEFFRVRAHSAPEQLYFGLSNDNNPAAVDVGQLSHTEAGVDGSTISTGVTVANQYFIVLVPSDHDVLSITDGLGQPVLSIFTRTANVRTIGTTSYISYVFGPVTAGSSESYTLGY